MKQLRKLKGDITYYVIPSQTEDIPRSLIAVEQVEDMVNTLIRNHPVKTLRNIHTYRDAVEIEIDRIYGYNADGYDQDWTKCMYVQEFTTYLYHRTNQKLDK